MPAQKERTKTSKDDRATYANEKVCREATASALMETMRSKVRMTPLNVVDAPQSAFLPKLWWKTLRSNSRKSAVVVVVDSGKTYMGMVALALLLQIRCRSKR